MSAKERGDQNAVVDALRSIQPAVFIPASVVIVAMIVVSVVYSSVAENAFVRLNSAITGGVGWWYILVATGFVVFALYCGISRIGTIRLGRDDELPEFSFWAWLAMLFSAGMGIGLVFYGVAEPLSHYLRPPRSRGVPALTDAAANQAMALTVFHWGLHAWAIYVVVGLGMAYMTYQRGRPLSVRWLLEPVVGRGRVEGALGHAVDVIAIVGTLFGVATSLGFGITQIASGLEYLGWIRVDNWWMVGMIAAITATATASVVSGVSKGEVAVEHQYGAGRRIGPVRVVARADTFLAAVVGAKFGRLRPVASAIHAAHRAVLARRLARRLDYLLLGLVDQLGSVCRDVHRADFAGTDDPGVHRGGAARSHRDRLAMVYDLR